MPSSFEKLQPVKWWMIALGTSAVISWYIAFVVDHAKFTERKFPQCELPAIYFFATDWPTISLRWWGVLHKSFSWTEPAYMERWDSDNLSTWTWYCWHHWTGSRGRASEQKCSPLFESLSVYRAIAFLARPDGLCERKSNWNRSSYAS